jgi:hypothetical protein
MAMISARRTSYSVFESLTVGMAGSTASTAKPERLSGGVMYTPALVEIRSLAASTAALVLLVATSRAEVMIALIWSAASDMSYSPGKVCRDELHPDQVSIV